MVSSIVPGASGANALGVDPRFARENSQAANQSDAQRRSGDKVELSGASLAAARESVRAGVNDLHQALAVGQAAQDLLLKVQTYARQGGAAQGELDAALQAFVQRVETAIGQGARVVAGEQIAVQAEPGAEAVQIEGADLRLKAEPSFTDILKVSLNAQAADPTLSDKAQRSLDALQEAMGRLMEATRALEAHQGFLSAAENAANVRDDLDAESARLMALQVSQGLEKAGVASIANVEPKAVLALFKA